MATKTWLHPCSSFVIVNGTVFWCEIEECDGMHHYYRRHGT